MFLNGDFNLKLDYTPFRPVIPFPKGISCTMQLTILGQYMRRYADAHAALPSEQGLDSEQILHLPAWFQLSLEESIVNM